MELEHSQFLLSLAEEYYSRCEAFDLQVCTGPTKNGTILPANTDELIRINKHATQVLRDIRQRTWDSEGLRLAFRQLKSVA